MIRRDTAHINISEVDSQPSYPVLERYWSASGKAERSFQDVVDISEGLKQFSDKLIKAVEEMSYNRMNEHLAITQIIRQYGDMRTVMNLAKE